MRQGIECVFVFDGKPPKLKQATLEKRAALKQEARRLYEEAAAAEDVDAMRKFASRTTRLTPEMVAEAKEVVAALGIPVVQAPSEGEAQAAHMAARGDVWAVVSQDADALLFGAPRLVRNLAVVGRRKRAGLLQYEEIKPSLVELDRCLSALGISHDQLLALALLVGTDYNPGGVHGIGPAKALKLVKQYCDDFTGMFAAVKWEEHCGVAWKELMRTFKEMPVTDDYKLHWSAPDAKRLDRLLVHEHGFSPERVRKALEDISVVRKEKQQRPLGAFL
jgi:flap endonuclease-1